MVEDVCTLRLFNTPFFQLHIDAGRIRSVVANGKSASSLSIEVFRLMDMQLFYKSGRLRIAIPTANFIDYDWRDIENVRNPDVAG